VDNATGSHEPRAPVWDLSSDMDAGSRQRGIRYSVSVVFQGKQGCHANGAWQDLRQGLRERAAMADFLQQVEDPPLAGLLAIVRGIDFPVSWGDCIHYDTHWSYPLTVAASLRCQRGRGPQSRHPRRAKQHTGKRLRYVVTTGIAE
jgi:hypothetical protein